MAARPMGSGQTKVVSQQPAPLQRGDDDDWIDAFLSTATRTAKTNKDGPAAAHLNETEEDFLESALKDSAPPRQTKKGCRAQRRGDDNGDSTKVPLRHYQNLVGVYRRLDGKRDSPVASSKNDDDAAI